MSVEEDQLRRALAASEERLQGTLSDLEAARREIGQADVARDRFFAMLVHELRMPLSPILNMAQVLEEDPLLPSRHRDGVAVIRRNVELEVRLVDDLLNLTRVAYGKLELALTEIDVAGKLREVLSGFDRQIREKRLIVTMRLEAADHRVRADPVRLHQILSNLIHNAVKFTPEAGRITVRSKNTWGAHRLVLKVADNGIGIERALLQRIFQPFEQGNGDIPRRFGGLGLGLAVCKSLVEAHKGTLTARSAGQGKGAAFTVRLPLAAPPPRRKRSKLPAPGAL
jgi:signal transduction histidine kinase